MATPLVKPVVSKTLGIQELLEDEGLCSRIAVVAPDLQKIITQTQQAYLSEENVDSAGPVVLGMRALHEVILLFAAKGATLTPKD